MQTKDNKFFSNRLRSLTKIIVGNTCMKQFVWLLLSFITLNSCTQQKSKIDYYVFPNQDSIDKALRDSLDHKGLPPPPPRIEAPPFIRWYSNVVMIFDTANNVYIYQTECIERMVKIDYNQIRDCQFGNYPKAIGKYPNFIGLNPDQMLTIKADYLLDFLKNNDTYFRLDTNYRDSNRFFYMVSDFNTIKNPGFYKLRESIKLEKRTRKTGNILYLIRKTTEEEKNVLSCKRTGKYYTPREFHWSSNFLDGKTKPFALNYDSVENNYLIKIKAKEIFKRNGMNIMPIK